MSKTHFYSHLVEYETVIVELDNMDLSDNEKMHLAQLVDANLHHSILDAVLSELDHEDKALFMEHLNSNEHNKIWEFLNNRVDKIEDKIKVTAEQLKEELHKDIKEAKRTKSAEK